MGSKYNRDRKNITQPRHGNPIAGGVTIVTVLSDSWRRYRSNGTIISFPDSAMLV